MKFAVTIPIILISILAMSIATPISAFRPSDYSVVVTSIDDSKTIETLSEGTLINITVFVKNFSNDTMRTVNVTQSFPVDINLTTSPFGEVTSGELNYTNSLAIKTATGESFTITSGYANVSYFEFSFESLDNESSFSFIFTFNATGAKPIEIDGTSIDYLDHWGDVNTVKSNRLSYTVLSLPEDDPSEAYFPMFETGDINWTQIIFIAVGLTILVSLTRVLYKKKPYM